MLERNLFGTIDFLGPLRFLGHSDEFGWRDRNTVDVIRADVEFLERVNLFESSSNVDPDKVSMIFSFQIRSKNIFSAL